MSFLKKNQPNPKITLTPTELKGDLMFSSVNVSAPSSVSTVTSTLPDTTNTDAIKNQLDTILAGRHPLVFGGFSGLEYADPAALEQWLDRVLQQAIVKHGAHNLMVVAGVTSNGIGDVYRLAKERYGLETMGLVSDKASGSNDISPYCTKENIVYVSGPKDSWEVKDSAGCSYMVYVAAQHQGDFYLYGGGQVAHNEFLEAQALGVKIGWNPLVEPDPEKLAKSQVSRPGQDLTPMKSYYEQHRHQGFGDNVTFIH